MKVKLFGNLITVVLALSLLQINLFATNGYLKHGYGVKYSALAGAGVALSLSSIGAATNPAGLAKLGTRYDLSLAFFNPNRDYEVAGNPSGFPGTLGLVPGKVESETNLFYIPTLGANWAVDEHSGLGVMLFANGGMNSDYPTRTFYDPTSNETGVNIEQMFLGLTYAREIVKNHSLGITALLGYQKFSAKGLLAFGVFSSDPSSLTGNRNSTATGYGVRIGYQGKLLPFLSIGAAYQTKVYMSEFEGYKGLFAEKGDFDVPANWTAGIAANVSDDLTLALDVQQILYGGVNSVGNTGDPAKLMLGDPLGTDNGPGFGWKDMTIVKFGAMWSSSSEWTWMAGYSYGSELIPETEVLFNILAPAVIQHHFTFGVSKKIGTTKEINLALTYAPSGNVEGQNPMEAPGQQKINLQMNQFQVEIGYAFN